MNIEYEQRYIENKPVPIIHFWKREGGIRKHIEVDNFEPYFFVKADLIDQGMLEEESRIKRVEDGFFDIYKNPVKKIVCWLPQHVSQLREMFAESLESDVPFTHRFEIDTAPDFGEEIDILFADIEVDASHGFPKPEEAKEKVTAISSFDTQKQKYWTFIVSKESSIIEKTKTSRVDKKEYPWMIKKYPDEISMLKDFIALVKHCDPDILSGWNCYRFDFEYLINRFDRLRIDCSGLSPIGKIQRGSERPGATNPREKYRIPLDIGGRVIMDALNVYKRIERKGIDSYSLDQIAKLELGIGKVDYGKKFQDLTEDELIEYNVSDVELVYEIDKKRKTISYFWGMANFIKCPPTQTESFSRMSDTLLLRLKDKNVALPNVRVTPNPATFEGGAVFDPPTGMFDNVVVFDITSLYPSLIMSCLFSPDVYQKYIDWKSSCKTMDEFIDNEVGRNENM